MLCKWCKIIMKSGITYEQERNKKGKNQLISKKFNQCPKCYDKVYNSSFYKTLKEEAKKEDNTN